MFIFLLNTFDMLTVIILLSNIYIYILIMYTNVIVAIYLTCWNSRESYQSRFRLPGKSRTHGGSFRKKAADHPRMIRGVKTNNNGTRTTTPVIES